MYQLAPSGAVLRVSDNSFIFPDESSEHWQAYLSWLGQGNTAASLTPLQSSTQGVPQEVSRFQGRAAIIQAGHMTSIQTYIDAPTTDILVKEAWANVTVFRRQSLMMLTVAVVLGLSEEDLDNLFIAAHAIGDV